MQNKLMHDIGGNMNSDLVNLSFYRFFRIGDESDLKTLKNELKSVCADLNLNGTILLAKEGINAMLTGTFQSVEIFKVYCRDRFGIENRSFKQANVTATSFTRMLIKIKKEIISVGDPSLCPDQETGKRISPKELKKWFDEGRDFHLLDTRNNYEVAVGTFKGAQELNLDSSREFTSRASQEAAKWKDKPVVTFCTGGIRCEKASASLLKLGLKDVYQLDGGILRYFEESGAAHFDGKCFVFDWRLAVDDQLRPIARSPDPEQEYGRHRRTKQRQEPT